MNRKSFKWLLAVALPLMLLSLLAGCGGSGGTTSPTQKPAEPTAIPEPTPAPTEAPTLPTSQYEHPDGLFGILYPTGWFVSETELSSGFSNAADTMGFFVNFSDLGETLDETGLNEYIRQFYASGQGIAANPGFERGAAIPQPDGSLLVEYTFESDGDTAYGASFYEQHGTVVYILTFLVLDGDEWNGMLPTFNEIAESFTVYESSGGLPEGWSTLTSVEGGYAFEYPSDWEAFEFEGSAYVSRDEETFLLVIVTTTLPAADPDEAERIMIEEVIASLRQDDPNAQIDEPDTIPLGGEPGLFADFIYVDPDTGLQNSGTVMCVVYQGRAYQFLAFTLTEDFSETSSYFIEMLVSFRFLQ
jgi:hypothetical protein